QLALGRHAVGAGAFRAHRGPEGRRRARPAQPRHLSRVPQDLPRHRRCRRAALGRPRQLGSGRRARRARHARIRARDRRRLVLLPGRAQRRPAAARLRRRRAGRRARRHPVDVPVPDGRRPDGARLRLREPRRQAGRRRRRRPLRRGDERRGDALVRRELGRRGLRRRRQRLGPRHAVPRRGGLRHGRALPHAGRADPHRPRVRARYAQGPAALLGRLHVLRRPMRWLVRGIAVVAVLAATLAGGLWWLLHSEAAWRWALERVQSSSGGALRIEGERGTPARELRFDRLVYAAPGFRVEVRGVVLRGAGLSGAATGRIAVDSLHVDAIEVTLSDQPGQAPKRAAPPRLALPLGVSVARADVAEVTVRRPGSELAFRRLAFAYEGGPMRHRVDGLTVETPWGSAALHAEVRAAEPFAFSGAGALARAD